MGSSLRLRALTALLVACLAAPGSAEPAPASAPEQAQALLAEGNAMLDDGLYLEALAAFERAYALFPSPKLLYNIAQVTNALGRYIVALDHYERFMREVRREDLPEQWAIASGRAAKLLGAIARVELRANLTGAQVTIDGAVIGETPLARPIRLMPGPHAIVVGKAGYARRVLELVLRAGDVRSEEVTLRSETGALRVTTSPPGVEVRLDDDSGAPDGVTPYQREGLTAGAHLVFLRKAGYVGVERGVTVAPDQTQHLELALRALPPPPPLYRRWWLWTSVVAAVGVVLVGALVGALPDHAAIPNSTSGVHVDVDFR